MTSEYCSSGSFVSRVRSKSIGHNTYTGRRIDFRSKPTPIYGTVHKSDFNYSYSIICFSRLLQAVAKKLIYRLSQKSSYDSNIINPVIDGFIPNDESSHFHICDHSIITFGINEEHFGF